MPRFTLLTLSCSVLLLAACGRSQPGDVLGVPFTPPDTDSPAVSLLPEGTFELNDQGVPTGTAYVRGYPMVEEVQEPFCESDCQKYNYVFLAVTDTSNAALKRFLKDNAGNTYASPERIGLGCIKDETLTYWNDSDQNGRQEFRLDPAISQAIMQATQENPVTLELTKLPLSSGAGAPACYAHFTTVEVFTPSSVAISSGSGNSSDAVAAGDKPCRPSGCSGQLCTDEEVMSTCEFKAEYACYQSATCERQGNGQCGWTMTEDLVSCLQNPPPLE